MQSITLHSFNYDKYNISQYESIIKVRNLFENIVIFGRFPFTSPRRQRRRQTRQRLFTLPKSSAGNALSINGNTGNAAITVLQVKWKEPLF